MPVPPLRAARKPVAMMLLSMTTQSGRSSGLPSLARTLPQAELFHRALIGRLGNGRRVDCPELTGRDTDGAPLRLDHVHAHCLPVDLDGDGRIDHLLVYANGGLGESAQAAVRSLRRTWMKGGVGRLQLAVVSHGDFDSLRLLRPPWGDQVRRLLGPKEGAVTWDSVTPLVLPRFQKPRGRNTLEGQICAELESRNLPPPDCVEILPGLTRSMRHHVIRRAHGRAAPCTAIGFGLRLTFPGPIHGPLCIGYASHFGLGQFRAVEP